MFLIFTSFPAEMENNIVENHKIYFNFEIIISVNKSYLPKVN